MSGQTRQTQNYQVPTGGLGLKGPVERPAPGTLALRGDLAHIALAGTHLAAHYVIPQIWTVGDQGVDVMETIRDDSPLVTHFEAGTKVEVIDVSGDWIWGCLGPEGPSGYMKANALTSG